MSATPAPDQLADELTDAILDASPVAATLVGIRNREDRMPDLSEAGDAAHGDRVREIAGRADALDPAAFEGEQRVTLAVVRALAASELDQLAVRATEYTVTDTFFAPAMSLLGMLSMTGITEPAHAEGYLARLAGLGAVLEAVGQRHRAGIAAGRLPVRRLAEATVAHLGRLLANPDADPLRRPAPAADLGVVDGEFRQRRDRLLAEVVYPALARYRDLLAAEVVPHGRPDDRPGLCWLPEGEDYYARLARAYTTTDRSPAELHQTGLDLIASLREEYAEVGARVFGTSDVDEIVARLRTDPALRWRDGEQLLDAARATVARAAQAAPQWFGRLPTQDCVVQAVPEAEAAGAPAAYYLSPALDGSRPGTYFANTHQAQERGRATYEALAFHEGVPGHHFQLTLAQELTDLPLLRRLVPFTAYAEGWGLYAERLADEMGLYSDDLARLGMISEDATRAARLVVDTGLHSFGWDRARVVDYLLANTASSPVEVATEADRYIAAPGQALAYMTGRLEIQRLRDWARQSLGDRFDIRSFHDTVLGSGGLPLQVLAELVRDWVRATGAADG
jgi:uncharacterized protein (DUF885 family)